MSRLFHVLLCPCRSITFVPSESDPEIGEPRIHYCGIDGILDFEPSVLYKVVSLFLTQVLVFEHPRRVNEVLSEEEKTRSSW